MSITPLQSATPRAPATAAVRAGIESDGQFGAIVPPLHLSANFSFTALGERRTYDYTRSGNPTRDLFGAALAELEGGAGALVTSSGMSAVRLVLELVPRGGLVVAPHDGYGGTFRLLKALERQGALTLELLDFADGSALERVLAREPAQVWIESPSNPLLRLVDIAATAARARDAGALVVVDNTFLSPLLQRPLDLGAHIAVHSTTKYLNGHSDIVGGAVVCRAAEHVEQLTWWANCTGVTGAPFDAWLALRGLRTLDVRLTRQQENGRNLARQLVASPAVSQVHYPGLDSHPQFELARRQQRGPGAMLSFELVGGRDAAARFAKGLAHISLAESLGGVETLLAHPATMTHAAMTPEAQARAGIGPGLLRLSVGIEHTFDLEADLSRALERAT